MYIYIYIYIHTSYPLQDAYLHISTIGGPACRHGNASAPHPSTLHHQGVGSPSVKEGGSHCAGWGSFAKLGNHMNMMIE